MKRVALVLILTFILLPLSGCGIGIDLPFKTVPKTGPLQTEQIAIQEPAGEPPINLVLAFGAGKINILPHPGELLVSGTASFNVEDFRPEVLQEENKITLKQGNLKLDAVPTLDDKIKNEWALALSDYPLDLTIKAGAYHGEYEFGGLAITDLHLTDGASNVTLRFSQPNQVEMNAFRYETGGSNISLEKLGNANFQTLIFQSGAGNYQLDFSGALRRNTSVFIETGLSRMVITVPEGVPARAQFEGPLAKINARGSWEQRGDEYHQSGQGPEILFTIETKAGTITLKNP
jgi:hypothetical protein